VCYNGSTYYLGVNGTIKNLGNSGTHVHPSAFQNLVLGTDGSSFYNVYFDEVRVSGLARYTANYTVPASEFATDSSTIWLGSMNAPSASKWISSAYISNNNVRFYKTSMLFDRNGHFSKVTLDTPLTSDWSTDFWLSPYDSSGDTYSTILSTSNGKYLKIDIVHIDSDKLNFTLGNGSTWTSSTGSTNSVSVNTWNHLAITYVSSSTTFKVYLNGVLEITKTEASAEIAGFLLGLGYGDYLSRGLSGYMNEFRISSIPRFSNAFNVNTQGVQTVDGSTVALCHFDYPLLGSTYIRDDVVTTTDPLSTDSTVLVTTWTLNSSSNKPNAVYTTEYSLYGNRSFRTFAWNSGWLSSAFANTAVNSYTVEFWTYITSLSADGGLVCSSVSQLSWYLQYTRNTGALAFNTRESGSWVATSCGTMPIRTWTHIAITYNIYGGYKVYVAGTLAGTASTTGTWASRFNGIRLGTNWQVSTDRLNACFDSVRVSAAILYTANFTPTNFAATSNGSILSSTTFYGTDAAFDLQATETATLTNSTYTMPWNSCTLTTAQSKFGNACLATGQTLTPSVMAIHPTDAWTIEYWFMFNGFNSSDVNFINTTSNWMRIYYPTSNGSFNMYILDQSGSSIANNNAAGTIVQGRWYHFAMQYNGTRYSMYIDGVEVLGFDSNTSVFANFLSELSFNTVNMYIDEMRISKVARYSGTFTPSGPFTADSNTIRLCHFNYRTADMPSVYSDTITNTSGTLSKITLPKKAPLYLYAVQHRARPCYLLSSRNMASGDPSPNVPVGWGSVRQLPYVFFTKDNGDLYNVSWSGRQATFFEDAPSIDRQLSVYHVAMGNLPGYYTLDFKNFCGISKLITVKIDKVAGSTSPVKFGADAVYGLILYNTMNSGTNTSSETHTIPLASNGTCAMVLTSQITLNFFVQGFYVTDI
jgi:hypothetical protein